MLQEGRVVCVPNNLHCESPPNQNLITPYVVGENETDRRPRVHSDSICTCIYTYTHTDTHISPLKGWVDKLTWLWWGQSSALAAGEKFWHSRCQWAPAEINFARWTLSSVWKMKAGWKPPSIFLWNLFPVRVAWTIFACSDVTYKRLS